MLACIAFLTACQGVSTPPPSQQLTTTNPPSLTIGSPSFGTVPVGSSRTVTVTATNSGSSGSSSVTISEVAISGSEFSFSGITPPVTLAAGTSTTFNVTFAPLSIGNASGTLTITSNASNPTVSIPLSGTGSQSVGSGGQLTATPSNLNLGSVVVGTSGQASGTLSASGASVTVTGAGTNNSEFSVGGLSLPVTIEAGQSIPFTVTFSPEIAGAVNATLTFTGTATATEGLSGTGTAAPTHTVSLSWDASTSPNISGYNIYRALYVNSCGSFAQINSVLNTSTLYTDASVTDGTSYCYATTAVNASNEESAFSNIASPIQIPGP